MAIRTTKTWLRQDMIFSGEASYLHVWPASYLPHARRHLFSCSETL